MSVEAAGAGRRERTKAVNRAAILDAARAVFGEAGYGAASVRDIIRRTGLAAGTFYNYFPDKASIFRALIDDVGAEARVRVRDARQRAASPEGFVEDGYRAYFAYIVEDPADHAFLSRNAGTIRTLFDDGQIPLGTEDLAQDLRAGIAAGHLPPVDVEYASHVMMAVGLELGLRLIQRDPPDVEGATRFATDLLLGGLERAARGQVAQMTDQLDLEAVRRALEAKRDGLAVRLGGLAKAPERGADLAFGKRIGDGTTEAVSRLTDVGVGRSLETTALQVDRALAKLDEGTYGICDACGRPIAPKRLRALPESVLCLEDAARLGR